MLKHIVFLLLFIQVLVSCDPSNSKDLYLDGVTTITATLVNPKDTIALGDSILMTFEVPDSIIWNGTKLKATCVNKDAFNLGFQATQLDSTVESGLIISPRDFTFYANPGKITNNIALSSSIVNGKAQAKLWCIPRHRGVYYLDQQQLGYLDVNNGNIKARLKINFGNIDRHYNLVMKAVKAADKPIYALKFDVPKVDDGIEVYAFCVY